MSETNANESYEIPMVPIGVVMDLQEELEVEIHQIVTRLPLMRTAIEAQWSEGIKEARFALEWGDPVNARLGKVSSILKRWMELDYGDGMIDISVQGRGRHGNHTDELVAVNNSEQRQTRLAEGAVDISKSALHTALGYIQEGKMQAINDQEFESAAIWRDHERNVKSALGGLGLAKIEE